MHTVIFSKCTVYFFIYLCIIQMVVYIPNLLSKDVFVFTTMAMRTYNTFIWIYMMCVCIYVNLHPWLHSLVITRSDYLRNSLCELFSNWVSTNNNDPNSMLDYSINKEMYVYIQYVTVFNSASVVRPSTMTSHSGQVTSSNLWTAGLVSVTATPSPVITMSELMSSQMSTIEEEEESVTTACTTPRVEF